MVLELDPEFKERFPEPNAFERILAQEGEVFRKLEGRRTLRFEMGSRGYFAKIHLGIGWKEIFKNLSQLRLPVLGAQNERAAIRRLEELGVATMRVVAYGRRGWNPARQQSFLVTEELAGTVSLEDFCRDWPTRPPAPALKRALIARIAGIARTLHENGINHRDFYICHFLLETASVQAPFRPADLKLYVIDLHRVQLRGKTPRRWIVKDLAGLCFSSMDIGLRRRDVLKFLTLYRGRPLRRIVQEEGHFWQEVERRARALYRRDFRREPSGIWGSDASFGTSR